MELSLDLGLNASGVIGCRVQSPSFDLIDDDRKLIVKQEVFDEHDDFGLSSLGETCNCLLFKGLQ